MHVTHIRVSETQVSGIRVVPRKISVPLSFKGTFFYALRRERVRGAAAGEKNCPLSI